jgi:tetratricopeptide (TPR) repeat protein
MPTKIARPPTEPLLASGADALWTDGDLRTAREWFDAAYLVAEHRDDGPAMAEAALGLAGLWVHEHRTTATTAVVGDRLRRARRGVADDSVLALRLRTRLAAEADYHAAGSGAVLARLAQARAAGDPVAVAEALALAHHCLLGPEHGAVRRGLADDLIAESSRTGRRGDLLVGLLLRAVDLLLDGDPRAARCLTELRCLLAAKDHLAVRFILQAVDVMAGIRAGRLDDAEGLAEQCARDGEYAGDADALTWFGAHMVGIRYFQGRIAELLPMIREMADSPVLSPIDHSYRAALAVAAAVAGERREALGAVAAFREGPAGIPSSSTWLVSMYALTEAAYLLGRTDVAEEAHRLLLPFRRLPMMASFGVLCFGSAEHALGVARLTLGDFDGAADHLEAAVRDNQALNHWPAATLARHRLAFALARSADAGRRSRAAVEAGTARHDAREFGMELPEFTEAETPQRTLIALAGEAAAAECRRQGRDWLLTVGSRSAVVGHCRGMAYLALLLANPGREISALELAGGSADAAGGRAVEALGLSATSQPVLDEQAVRQYRTRLEELRAIIERCDVVGDAEGAVLAHAEQDWLLGELRTATGLSGRARSFPTSEEHARISVGKAVRRALARVAAADPELGELLGATIHTGRLCAYLPFAGRRDVAR